MEALITELYRILGVELMANEGDVFGLAAILFILLASIFKLCEKGGAPRVSEDIPKKDVELEQPIAKEKEEPLGPTVSEAPPIVEIKVSWSDKLKKGLSQSRNEIWGKLGSFFGKGSLSEEQLEEVEELLYSADIGPKMVQELIEGLEEKNKEANFDQGAFKEFLGGFIREKMGPIQTSVDTGLFEFNKEKGLKVIMIVGVNGAGKTTTIGKLATKLTAQGAKVVVGACDTFRAAAVDQLQVWCERSGATMIRAKEGSNPSGVGYEALQSAMAQKADYCILDTAGRLHTKGNLMEELKKSKEVLKKLDPSAPHHTLLVLDAITGQNAMRQAEEFHQTLDLTGLIFTKCDGSSKAGSAISIVEKLNVPITYIGVGESVEDLNTFHLDDYIDALLA